MPFQSEMKLAVRNFFPPPSYSQSVSFFHGFTAGPYQFEPLGQALFARGYNVLIPLQPGHGIAGDWNCDCPPPLPVEPKDYQDFALFWLQTAQNLGEEVLVGGLSTGGILAIWLALEYPQQIAKALLFAPYVSGYNFLVNFLVETLPFYYEWLNKDNPGNFGYDGFQIPALRLFLDLAQELLKRIQQEVKAPVFIIGSESDLAIAQQELEDLFLAVVKHQNKSWYFQFEKIFEVPHTMMTKAEGNKYQDLLISIANSYIESDITWQELLNIGAEMLQGKTFDNAVRELDLVAKISPEVAVLLTVLKKKTIIEHEKQK